MLARLQKSLKDKDQGFTLIELLVVIVIIGILAAIAIPLFLNQRKKGVDASMKSDLKNAATMIETYMTENPVAAVPSGGPTGATTVSAALADFTPSQGNTIKVTGRTGTEIGEYCIDAQNAASSKGTTSYLVYDSAAGGLLSAWDANGCAPTT